MTPVTDLKDHLEGVINPLIGAHLLGSTGLIYFTDEVWWFPVVGPMCWKQFEFSEFHRTMNQNSSNRFSLVKPYVARVLSWSISKNWLSTLLFAKAGGERLSQKSFLPREGGWIMNHWEVSKCQMLGKVSGKSGWNILNLAEWTVIFADFRYSTATPVRSTCNSPKCLRATCTTFGLSKVWTQFENKCKQLGHLLQFFWDEENHLILELHPPITFGHRVVRTEDHPTTKKWL